MSTVFDNDILIHYITSPGLSGDGFTNPEAATLRADLDDLLSRPLITELDAVPDVNAPDPTNGQALVFDTASNTWKAKAVRGTISRIQNEANNVAVDNVHTIILQPGLTITPNTGFLYIAPSWGTSGTSTNVARSDHNHALPVITRVPITPQAYMSSGTRQLASASVVLPNTKQVLIEARLKLQVRGGDPGASYYTLRLEISGDARSSPTGTNGFWCVQGVPDKPEWAHSYERLGNGASHNVAASISWNGGGGFYTDAGELEIKVTASR